MKSSYSLIVSPFLLLLSLGVGSPGCQTSPGGVTDTNTNWLHSCDTDAACGALACHCGVCTNACDNNSQCSELGNGAVCAYKADDACETQKLCLNENASDTVLEPTELTSRDATLATNSTTTRETGTSSLTHIESSGSTNLSSSRLDASVTLETEQDSSADASLTTSNTTDASVSSTTAENTSTGSDTSETSNSGSNCDSAVDESACSVEGESCGGPCVDACNFCNLLRCTNGAWQRMEIFPAPCFDCGDGARCNPFESYCQYDGDTSYSCEPLPSECAGERTCECIAAGITATQLTATECTATGEGFTVEVSGVVASDGGADAM
jgi:hypothetical protein